MTRVSQCMVCASERENTPRILASGLSPVQTHRLFKSNFNGHLLFQADRLSCSYLYPPGGTNFTLPVLILSLSGRRSNHSYGRFIH